MWVCWLFEGGLKVSSDTVEWYRSTYGTDVDTSKIASSVLKSPRRGIEKQGTQVCADGYVRECIIIHT